MPAAGTGIDVTTQGSRATTLDCTEHLQMLAGEPGLVPIEESRPCIANDIGHLEGWRLHFLTRFRERFT